MTKKIFVQARARAELREEATVQDANDVISLVKHSLMDTFSDEFGNIQLSRSINGSGVSSRNKVRYCLVAYLFIIFLQRFIYKLTYKMGNVRNKYWNLKILTLLLFVVPLKHYIVVGLINTHNIIVIVLYYVRHLKSILLKIVPTT